MVPATGLCACVCVRRGLFVILTASFRSRGICHVDMTCSASHGVTEEHLTRPGVHGRSQKFLVTFLCRDELGVGVAQKCGCICPSSTWRLAEARMSSYHKQWINPSALSSLKLAVIPQWTQKELQVYFLVNGCCAGCLCTTFCSNNKRF